MTRNFAVWGGGVAAPSEIDDSKSKTTAFFFELKNQFYNSEVIRQFRRYAFQVKKCSYSNKQVL
jgi:hypothetical protein